MAKILLLSIVIGMIAIPVLAAREENPRRALRNTVLLTAAFNVLYLLAVRFIYPHLN